MNDQMIYNNQEGLERGGKNQVSPKKCHNIRGQNYEDTNK